MCVVLLILESETWKWTALSDFSSIDAKSVSCIYSQVVHVCAYAFPPPTLQCDASYLPCFFCNFESVKLYVAIAPLYFLVCTIGFAIVACLTANSILGTHSAFQKFRAGQKWINYIVIDCESFYDTSVRFPSRSCDAEAATALSHLRSIWPRTLGLSTRIQFSPRSKSQQ